MEPTTTLERLWGEMPNGNAHRDFYFSQPEDFQRFMCLLVDASKEDVKQIIALLELKEATA